MSFNCGLSNAKISVSAMKNIGVGPKKPYRSSYSNKTVLSKIETFFAASYDNGKKLIMP